MSDAGLYARGIETLLACWAENARGASGASVVRSPGVAVALFPGEPERPVFNNAVLYGGMGRSERASAVEVMESIYASGGIANFAAWVHESDSAMSAELVTRGYSLNESTMAMGMSLDKIQIGRPTIDVGPSDWLEYLQLLGVPGLLGGADPEAYHIVYAAVGFRPLGRILEYVPRVD